MHYKANAIILICMAQLLYTNYVVFSRHTYKLDLYPRAWVQVYLYTRMKVCIAGGTSTLTTFYIALYIVYPLMFGVISIYVGNKREVKWQHLSGIEHKVSGWSHHNGIIQTTGQPAAFAFLFICLKTNKSFLYVCLFVCLFVFCLFFSYGQCGCCALLQLTHNP